MNYKPKDAIDVQNQEVRDLTVINLANQMKEDKATELGFRAIHQGKITSEKDLDSLEKFNKTFGKAVGKRILNKKKKSAAFKTGNFIDENKVIDEEYSPG